MSSVAAVKVWIWLSVFATCAGWLLSFFGALGLVGFIVLGVITLITCSELRNRGLIERGNLRFHWNGRKLRRRFCRPFPLLFLGLAVLVLAGELLYPPTNHTGLSYRIPRVLHWLEAGQWHWIYAPNYRMNTRACGIEWMSAPLLALFKSDRFLFLLNYVPFLLLPGLLFSLLTRLGVRARAAWQWMWVFPTGYVFLLQAGSAGNDSFPTIYAIAAVDFVCRAWVSRRANDLWYSALALSLLTGAKASNMPLGLMWLIPLLPLWRLLKEKPIGTSVVALLALLVSFIPTALLNLGYCGSWSGLQLENAGMEMKNPFVGLWGNPLLLLGNNLCPPFFPLAGWWNQNVPGLTPGFLWQPLLRNFEINFHMLWEIPTEDWVGIGPGITGLALIAGAFALRGCFRPSSNRWPQRPLTPLILKLTLLAPWIGLAAYCAKSGMVTPARLIAPYYPLLLPGLLIGAEQAVLARQRWWRGLVWAVFAIAFVVLIVTPPRPLWPAKTILGKLTSQYPENRLLARALATYQTYAVRSDPLAHVRAMLPPDLKTVGFVGTADDLDISFWRPFGKHNVAHISVNDTPENIRARKLSYFVVSGLVFDLAKLSFDEWLAKTQLELVTNTTATISVQTGERKWYIVRFKE